MSVLVADILCDVSLVLMDAVISRATYGSSTPAGVVNLVGASWVTDKIYVGAQLVIGVGLPSQEIVVVTSITPSTGSISFTAVNGHANTDKVLSPLFSAGQLADPLYTLVEMLGYVADVQHEFLLKAMPVFTTATEALSAGVRFYANPSDCIQIGRISIAGNEMWSTTQKELDLSAAGAWESDTAPPTPTEWYEDEIASATHGYHPTPQMGAATSATLWYAQGASNSLSLTDTLLVPDVFSHWIKYGVLSRAYSKDGEMRDPMRADYCDRRFKHGLFLAGKFLDGPAEVRLGDPKLQIKEASFSRFPVPQEAQGAQ